MPWNYGDLLEAVSASVPQDNPALIHEDRVIAWGEARRRMNNLARALASRGLRPGDKVAFYLRNSAEYMETVGACLLGRFVHVNVNYRYKPEEVRYILDNADARALIYVHEFRAAVAEIRETLPMLDILIETGGEASNFSESYDRIAEFGDGAPLGIERSPDDLFFIYTGGTTGMPKGVMYRQGDLCSAWLARLQRTVGFAPSSIEMFAGFAKMLPVQPRVLPACPQMHGTGILTSLMGFLGGGAVVTLGGAAFDAEQTWAEVARHRVTTMAIVGDPFARPLLRVLDENPGRFDLTCLNAMTSSGAMWSAEIKQGLLRHLPQATLTDNFASTEALGLGNAITTKDGEVRTAGFVLGENSIVIDDDDNPIEPGNGKAGRVAVAGTLPIGYYKDPEKTARTFCTIGGTRYSIPGDYAIVEADGKLTLLGRGSNCINTAGEKVYPEEVEEALKTHPSVEDALVLGVPDDIWGQAVTALVALAPDALWDEAELRAHVRDRLAGYKTPKRVLLAEFNLRAPNGKADYKTAGEFARCALGLG